jgi:hypothetical protein
METSSSSSLLALRNALARRKARKALIARLARRKAEAMEAVYGWKASLALRHIAEDAEQALALNKA